ncbi:unnamed protein product [Calicophoron daubneyi]|uniref:G-protein coupled receptors family 1 profile domain-containing protein n=1 Tax=Calicophoron daubneyi TaxID=300641 RepID=A0AAV2T2C7_CALDB
MASERTYRSMSVHCCVKLLFHDWFRKDGNRTLLTTTIMLTRSVSIEKVLSVPKMRIMSIVSRRKGHVATENPNGCTHFREQCKHYYDLLVLIHHHNVLSVITEHKRCGAKPPKNPAELDKLERDSAIAVHGLLEGHNIGYDNPSILERGLRSHGQRCVAEVVHITRHIKNVNRNTGCEISPIWHDLIFRHTKTKPLGSTPLKGTCLPSNPHTAEVYRPNVQAHVCAHRMRQMRENKIIRPGCLTHGTSRFTFSSDERILGDHPSGHLMVAVGGMLPEIVGRLTAFEYTSDPLCKMVKYVSTAITYSSSFALIVLSIDRAEAVCRPFRAASHGMSNKTQAHLMIAVAWILAGLCGLPGLLMGYMQPDGKYKGVCMLSFARIRPQIYFTCIFVSVFLVPAVLITVCHVVMVVTIWRAPKLQAASFDGYPNHRVTVTDERCSVSSIEHGDVSRRSRAILRRSILRRASASKGFPNKPSDMKRPKPGSISRAKVKTVKMTCVIVSAYIVCWCPFMVWNLLVTYNVIQRAARHLMQYTPLIQHLVPLNSAANPIIFWIFSAGSVRRKRNARIIIHAQRGQHTNN